MSFHFEHKNNPANIVLSDVYAPSARLILVSRHRPLPHQHGQGTVGVSVPATHPMIRELPGRSSSFLLD